MLKIAKLKELAIVLLALCCMVVSIPVSYLVNTYRMMYLVEPSDILTNFILFLPYLFLSIVLAYGAFDIKKLANDNQKKEAATLTLILMALVLVAALIMFPYALSFGKRYIL